MGACSGDHLTVVNLLLQLPEGSINIQDGFMIACYKGHLSVIKSFLELPQGRFNVDETDEDDETGLDLAVQRGHQDIMDAILQYKNKQ